MWRLITHRESDGGEGDLETLVEGDLLDSFMDELRELRSSKLPQDIKHRVKLHTDILTPLFNALSYPQA
jgi:hypothetical protein